MARLTMSTPICSSSFAASSASMRRQAADQGHATARNDAFFDGRAGRVQRVFDAGFLFLHLGFGRGADIDDGHATGELGQAFLQFFAVVIGGGFFDLAADLVDAALDLGRSCRRLRRWWCFPCRSRCVLARPRSSRPIVLELDAEVFGDELAAGEDGDVFAAWLCGDRRSQGL